MTKVAPPRPAQLSGRPPRRRFLRHAGGWVLAGAAVPAMASLAPRPADARQLALSHTHTGERITLVYAEAGGYLPQALGALNRFLRDHYSGEVGRIAPDLFDQLHRLQQALGARGAFEIISGYRCPATNERLRTTRGGGVAKRSLHMDGRALDIRLPGVPLAELRDAAVALRAGGVGYYPAERFVHIDNGPLRRW